MSLSEVSESTAHTVLNYAILEAIRQKKSVKIKLQIPYKNIAFSNGFNDADLYPDTGLIFNATLTWAALTDEDLVVEETDEALSDIGDSNE